MRQPMLCAYCGSLRTWPEDFPTTHYARCRTCWNNIPEKDGSLMSRMFVLVAIGFVLSMAIFETWRLFKD